MDPLSITATVISLTTRCTTTSIQQLIRAGRPELERAKDDIASLIPKYHRIATPLLESIDRISVKSLESRAPNHKHH
jgi:hypothetical protein